MQKNEQKANFWDNLNLNLFQCKHSQTFKIVRRNAQE